MVRYPSVALRGVVCILLAGIFPILEGSSSTLFQADVSEHFERVWARTDLPVQDEQVNRTWMWGPTSSTDVKVEPYAESPSGERVVSYFEKSRMEITYPDNDVNSVWYVTNGLLVLELMEGKIQRGDNDWIDLSPSLANVAGDSDDRNGPTYSTMNSVRDEPPAPEGAIITLRVDRNGSIVNDGSLSIHNVSAAHRVQVPNIDHQVASPFWEFMTADGTIWADGQYQEAKLFENPFFATGLPLTEAYWSEIKVGGTLQEVLIQCFERRCLTYTPDNPDGWKVEAGNVGKHYHSWRYASVDNVPTFEGTFVFQGRIDDGCRQFYGCETLYTIDADGSNVAQLTDGVLEAVFGPKWSPDGTEIVYGYQEPEGCIDSCFFRETDLYVYKVSDGTIRQLTDSAGADDRPAWSPDGTQIVFRSARNGQPGLYIMNYATGDVRWLIEGNEPTWSPDGSMIAFSRFPTDGEGTFVLDLATMDLKQILDFRATSITWAPTSDALAFHTNEGLYTIASDGSQQLHISTFGYSPRWSKDGTHILFGWHDGENNLYALDMSTLSSTIIYTNPYGRSFYHWDWYQP